MLINGRREACYNNFDRQTTSSVCGKDVKMIEMPSPAVFFSIWAFVLNIILYCTNGKRTMFVLRKRLQNTDANRPSSQRYFRLISGFCIVQVVLIFTYVFPLPTHKAQRMCVQNDIFVLFRFVNNTSWFFRIYPYFFLIVQYVTNNSSWYNKSQRINWFLFFLLKKYENPVIVFGGKLRLNHFRHIVCPPYIAWKNRSVWHEWSVCFSA